MATDNAALIKRLVDEVVNGRNLDIVDQLVTDDYLYIDTTFGRLEGPAHLKRIISQVLAAFPDLKWSTVEQIIGDEKIVSRFQWVGTQISDFGILKATGKTVTVDGVCIDRFSKGKFVETRMLRDDLGLLRQLGVVPEREPT